MSVCLSVSHRWNNADCTNSAVCTVLFLKVLLLRNVTPCRFVKILQTDTASLEPSVAGLCYTERGTELNIGA
jgi:hypothetical protein